MCSRCLHTLIVIEGVDERCSLNEAFMGFDGTWADRTKQITYYVGWFSVNQGLFSNQLMPSCDDNIVVMSVVSNNIVFPYDINPEANIWTHKRCGHGV